MKRDNLRRYRLYHYGKRFGLGIMALLLSIALATACGNTADQTNVVASIDTHPIEHAMGITNVPMEPNKVVVLDTAPLDAAIALGITPIGAWVNETFPNYLGEQTNGIVSVGLANQPNIEKIAQLKPDLILGSKVNAEAVYSQLSQIAPTVLTESNGREGNWPKQLRLYGKALGRSDRVDQLLDQYEQQSEAVRQQVGTPEDIIVSVVFSFQSHIGFYSHTSFAGSVLTDVGFTRPKIQTQPVSATYLSVVSKESFQDLDGDIIFLLTSDSSDNLALEEFVTNPLYSQLSAVKANKIYTVETEVWSAGRNVLAAQQILNDIYLCNYFTG